MRVRPLPGRTRALTPTLTLTLTLTLALTLTLTHPNPNQVAGLRSRKMTEGGLGILEKRLDRPIDATQA